MQFVLGQLLVFLYPQRVKRLHRRVLSLLAALLIVRLLLHRLFRLVLLGLLVNLGADAAAVVVARRLVRRAPRGPTLDNLVAVHVLCDARRKCRVFRPRKVPNGVGGAFYERPVLSNDERKLGERGGRGEPQRSLGDRHAIAVHVAEQVNDARHALDGEVGELVKQADKLVGGGVIQGVLNEGSSGRFGAETSKVALKPANEKLLLGRGNGLARKYAAEEARADLGRGDLERRL